MENKISVWTKILGWIEFIVGAIATAFIIFLIFAGGKSSSSNYAIAFVPILAIIIVSLLMLTAGIKVVFFNNTKNVVSAFLGFILLFLWFMSIEFTPKMNRMFADPVLSKGSMISVYTPLGNIKISAVDKTKRSYSWWGGADTVRLDGTNSGLHKGMDLYYAGDRADYSFSKPSFYTFNIYEGKLYFKDEKEFLAWITNPNWSVDGFQWVCRNDGLCIGYSLYTSTKCIKVYQVYIDHKKPISLPGANDDKILVYSG